MSEEFKTSKPDPETKGIVQRAFEIADTLGHRGTKIAKIFNKDPAIPDKYKPFYGCTIDNWLQNPLYAGVYELGHTNTDIVDDVRVVRAVTDPSEILRVEEFCEAIVPRDRFERIQQVNAERAAARAARKAKKEKDSAKLIKPLVPGLSLVHPLAGIVCCGKCEAAMVPVARPAE